MRLTIRARLIAVFAVMISLLGVSSYLGLKQASDINAGLRAITGRYAVVQEALALKASVAEAMTLVRAYLMADDSRQATERSQQAAGEIGALSGQTVEVSGRAGRMLGTLVPDIRRTADLVREISASTRAFDRAVQQNAAAAGQSAATSQELAAQSQELDAMTAYFRVADDGRAPAAARPPRAAGFGGRGIEAFDLDLAAERSPPALGAGRA